MFLQEVHKALKTLWTSFLKIFKKDADMSLSTSRIVSKIPTSTNTEIPSQNSPVTAIVKSSVGLKFSNGYEFNITFENRKMIISATMEGKEAFYLDEIPQEFIESLRGMLNK